MSTNKQDIEQQIRMARGGFGITKEAFNAMDSFDKAYFFTWKGIPISERYEGKYFIQMNKIGNFCVEKKSLNGKDCEYKVFAEQEMAQTSSKLTNMSDDEINNVNWIAFADGETKEKYSVKPLYDDHGNLIKWPWEEDGFHDLPF